ncbi:SigE family RNA polymerase sigma factor [Actinopolymorpha sp. B17G11]|uniref:SigE family RNA polymerase sigma factor n=1 Tax=Actinopolymorpha sp. B17G11 TaxID=3160861 RepID=UPI0032E453C8
MADRTAEFSAYVAARQHALVRTAFLLTGDHHTAEDLAQTALARTYLAWERIRDKGSLDAYVRRVMVNEHTTWWRRAWRRRERSTDNVPEEEAWSPPDMGERAEVWTLVCSLPPRQRAAVVLRYYEDLSEAETAQALGCSVGTVKSQTSRAIATLRERLAGDEPRSTSYLTAEGGS